MPALIRRLDQVKAIADPVRLRILEALAVAPRTVKEVAALIDRQPTGLYHHLRVLQTAGLVRETERRRKRGTIECRYVAATDEIRLDPRAFGVKRAPARSAVLSAVTQAVDADLAKGDRPGGAMLGLRLTIDVAPERLGELEGVLRSWATRGRRGRSSPHTINVIVYAADGAPRARRRRTLE